MKKVFVVHGMQRSGNHAIIQWIEAHGRFVFYNNVIPMAPILLGERTMPPEQEFTDWLRTRLSYRHRFLPFPLVRLALRNHLMMLSLEDLPLDTSVFRNCPVDLQHILILRDPRNMFASRIHRAWQIDHPTFPRTMGPLMERVIDTWKNHAREFLTDTQQLGPCVRIYFDDWFSDVSARKAISQQLGLPFTDAGLERVSEVGGGSSFEGTDFDGSSRKMNVLDRSTQLEPQERALFDQVFEDTELQALSERLAAKRTT